MNDGVHGQECRRKFPARFGITALNLIAPGLGLLRLGYWRLAVPFLLAPFAVAVPVTFGMGHLPITSYGRAVFVLVVFLGLLAALFVVPAVLTWRKSRFLLPAQGWSRWYVVVAVATVVVSLSQFTTPFMHSFYKPFYVPSESMSPTIAKDDKLIADMRWRGPFRRGDIVMFRGPDSVRINRIAALPGDRFAMRGGVPILNGRPAVQSPSGQTTFTGYQGAHSAAMLTEQLPGEASTHRVLNIGRFRFDDVQEVVVPANHLFVLGDNRDRSADSRVPPELEGVAMVPLSAIIGRPMYIHWSSDRSRIGTRLDR
ncbi:MAG: Signal peptidase [Alphaproteobacteria bacterium]|nr:Signal peptidase [Alphaproteobacteria bacterium]